MKRVLFCSVGLSPQVVTETLYALDRQENWQPDELIIVTTPGGKAGCKRLLLDGNNGALVRYGREWRAKWAKRLAHRARLEVVATDSGDLDDLRGAQAYADHIMHIMRQICADPCTELHVSLAGGRKVSAALLALTISVCGRQQDRLSHVLIPGAVLANPDFFYPPPHRKDMVCADGSIVDLATVPVTLLDIPFPHLSRLFPTGFREFSNVMAKISDSVSHVRLVIDCGQGAVFWDDRPITFPPALAAWLTWLAGNQLKGAKGVPRVGAARSAYLHYYARFAGIAHQRRMSAILPDPLDAEWMEEKASRLAKLAMDCGVRPRGARLIQRIGPRAHAVYRIALDAHEIDVVGAWPRSRKESIA